MMKNQQTRLVTHKKIFYVLVFHFYFSAIKYAPPVFFVPLFPENTATLYLDKDNHPLYPG